MTEFFFKTDLPDLASRCIIYLPKEQMHLPEFCMNYRYIINNNTKRKVSPVAVLDLVKKYLVAKSNQLLKAAHLPIVSLTPINLVAKIGSKC